MTINKAIEILTSFTGEPNKELEPDLIDAIKLGSEALLRLQEHRTEHIDISFRALPGETKE